MTVSSSILDSGPVVQAVILVLFLGSVASWAIIIHKLLTLRAFHQDIRRVEAYAASADRDGAPASRLLADLLAAREAEGDAPGGEGRAARALAMRHISVDAVRRHEGGLPFLATLAATAPFIGLFGTVWGIMRSFAAIADSNDTSLAVVAPGIAEALFATAMGLAAAIPAVVAFNLVRASLRQSGHRLGAVVATLAKRQPMPGRMA